MNLAEWAVGLNGSQLCKSSILIADCSDDGLLTLKRVIIIIAGMQIFNLTVSSKLILIELKTHFWWLIFLEVGSECCTGGAHHINNSRTGRRNFDCKVNIGSRKHCCKVDLIRLNANWRHSSTIKEHCQMGLWFKFSEPINGASNHLWPTCQSTGLPVVLHEVFMLFCLTQYIIGLTFLMGQYFQLSAPIAFLHLPIALTSKPITSCVPRGFKGN